MSGIDTFIFDCDGTILDTLPDLAAATNKTLSDLGYPVHTQDEIESFIGDGARRLIYLAVPPSSTEEEREVAFKHWCKIYVEEGFSLTKHFPGMAETLTSLKKQGCKLAVLSNKINDATQLVVDQYFPGVFDVVYGERKGIPRKPDPKGLLSIMEELQASPSATMYAGDAVTDVEVARRAGVYSVAVSWGYTAVDKLESSKPDFIARTPADFLKLREHPN